MKKKFSLSKITEFLSNDEMKNVKGGSGNCPYGQFSCTCNGTSYGCVSSINECWNKC